MKKLARHLLVILIAFAASVAGASAQSYEVPANERVLGALANGKCPVPQNKRWLYYGRENFKSSLVAITKNDQPRWVSIKLDEFDRICGKR